MDLGTVKRNINQRKYKSIPDAAGMQCASVLLCCLATEKKFKSRERKYPANTHATATPLAFDLVCFCNRFFVSSFAFRGIILHQTQPIEDIRLVWTNCMTYNQDGSDFFLLAKNLSKKFEEKYSKLINDLQLDVRAEGAGSSSTNNSGVVTLDEKRSFAKTLYTLSKEDLGKLIVEVDNKCPAALTKNMGEDEAELNVDKIPPPLFQELKTFVANCHTTAPATKKGTKRKSS